MFSSKCYQIYRTTTACKLYVFGVILVHIFPHSDWIRRDTEYLSVFSPISVRIQSYCGKIRTRRTPNTDTFYPVNLVFFVIVLFLFYFDSFANSPFGPHFPVFGLNMKICGVNLHVYKFFYKQCFCFNLTSVLLNFFMN